MSQGFLGTTYNGNWGNMVGTVVSVSLLRLLCPQSCSTRSVTKLSGEKWAEHTKEYLEGHGFTHIIRASHTAFGRLSCGSQWYETPVIFFEWLVHPGTIQCGISMTVNRLANCSWMPMDLSTRDRPLSHSRVHVAQQSLVGFTQWCHVPHPLLCNKQHI